MGVNIIIRYYMYIYIYNKLWSTFQHDLAKRLGWCLSTSSGRLCPGCGPVHPATGRRSRVKDDEIDGDPRGVLGKLGTNIGNYGENMENIWE